MTFDILAWHRNFSSECWSNWFTPWLHDSRVYLFFCNDIAWRNCKNIPTYCGSCLTLFQQVAYLPIPGGHIKLSERFVDPAFSFAMGWNYWYVYLRCFKIKYLYWSKV